MICQKSNFAPKAKSLACHATCEAVKKGVREAPFSHLRLKPKRNVHLSKRERLPPIETLAEELRSTHLACTMEDKMITKFKKK